MGKSKTSKKENLPEISERFKYVMVLNLVKEIGRLETNTQPIKNGEFLINLKTGDDGQKNIKNYLGKGFKIVSAKSKKDKNLYKILLEDKVEAKEFLSNEAQRLLQNIEVDFFKDHKVEKEIVAKKINDKYKDLNIYDEIELHENDFYRDEKKVRIFKVLNNFWEEGLITKTFKLGFYSSYIFKSLNDFWKVKINAQEKFFKLFPKNKTTDSYFESVKDTEIFLDSDGNLYKDPKREYCYPMGKDRDRYKIVCFLAKNEGYQPTKLISYEVNNKSEKSIRTEIGKIRNNIDKYLKINGKDVIEGKKENGYRINPKYKFIFKN